MSRINTYEGRQTTMEEEVNVSVIIPVYNDPEGIETTLKSVTSQTIPSGEFEILVVDNNSTDNTQEVATKFERMDPSITVLVEDKIQSSYAARNRGIRQASGNILAFIDADMSVSSDWLEFAIKLIECNNIDYLGCNVDVYKDSKNIISEYSCQTEFPIEEYMENKNFGITGGIFVRKEVFDNVGLFDQRLISGGDFEFGNRVKGNGYDQYFASEIVMQHPARETISSLVRKSKRIGIGHSQGKELHPARYSDVISLWNPRLYLPPLPNTVKGSCTDWDALSPVSKVLFYAIFYLRTWFYIWGRVKGSRRSYSESSEIETIE